MRERRRWRLVHSTWRQTKAACFERLRECNALECFLCMINSPSPALPLLLLSVSLSPSTHFNMCQVIVCHSPACNFTDTRTTGRDTFLWLLQLTVIEPGFCFAPPTPPDAPLVQHCSSAFPAVPTKGKTFHIPYRNSLYFSF